MVRTANGISVHASDKKLLEEEVENLEAQRPTMPVPQGVLICLGLVLTTVGVVVTIYLGVNGPVPLFGLGMCVTLGGFGLLGAGFCRSIKKHLVPGVPGHFLLHPRTGTRFSPQQGLAIQRRLDRIRREMSADSVGRPEPDTPLPSTPPPWTMEPPPSYDTVMKGQEHSLEEGQEQSCEDNQGPCEERTDCSTVAEDSNQC